MRHADKMDLLNTVRTILDRVDSTLSWDKLPNRHDIKRAIKFTNTLISTERSQHEAEQRWIKFKYDDV